MLCLFLPNNSICITITNRRVNRHCFYFIIRYFIITRRTIFTIRIRCFSRSFNRCIRSDVYFKRFYSVYLVINLCWHMLMYLRLFFSLFEPFMTLYRSYMYSVSRIINDCFYPNYQPIHMFWLYYQTLQKVLIQYLQKSLHL